MLDQAPQALTLGWSATRKLPSAPICPAPSDKIFRAGFERAYGHPPSEEQVATYIKVWKRDHLALISEDLSGEWKQRFLEIALSNFIYISLN